MFGDLVKDIPEGKFGNWSIEHFEVTQCKSDFTRLREAIGHPGEYIPAGNYVKLCCDGEVVMSNTPMETNDISEMRREAHGQVLIGGLGLGLAAMAVAQKESVQSVTVVEKSADVIALVDAHIDRFNRAMLDPENPKITIIHGDVFTWQSPRATKYDFIYMDIWNYIRSDNLPEMVTLRKRFRRCRAKGSKFVCWSADRLRG